MTGLLPLGKCLVVGASGFVGRPLCAHLKSTGAQVRALLRAEPKEAGAWSETVFCDLKNFKAKESEIFKEIETVFYLASIAHNKAPVEEYQSFNVELCQRFAQAALRGGVKRFIYVSSTKAMAEPYEVIADEDFDGWPKDKYGISKRQAEDGLLALDGFEHLSIVRPCLIYGVGVQGNLQSMIKSIQKGWFPSLPETHQKRSMISVDDVASALVAVASANKANREVYILSDGQGYSVKQIENAMRSACQKNIPVWYIPSFIFKAIAVVGDGFKKVIKKFPIHSEVVHKLLGPAQYSSHKIQQDLGWKPQDDFYTVLPAMVEQEKIKQEK